MDPKQLFTQAIDQVAHCIEHVHDDQLGNDTPCSDWDLRQLLNHLVYEVLWIPNMLAGKTVAEVGDKYDGDVLGDDIGAAWQSAADKALAAVEQANLTATVHLSYADVAAEHYIKEVGADVCIHGWDVAQSTKCNLIIDSKLAQAIYDFMLPRQAELRASGLFGEAVDVPNTADIQTKLLGLMGRQAERTDGTN